MEKSAAHWPIGVPPCFATQLSTCDNDRHVQSGLLSDSFYGSCCVFADVLNILDSDTRKALQSVEGHPATSAPNVDPHGAKQYLLEFVPFTLASLYFWQKT